MKYFVTGRATRSSHSWRRGAHGRPLFMALAIITSTMPVYADSPWEQAVTVLQTAFTTTIARGLSLVAIVIGGLMFAFGEGESKRLLAGIVFGVGMAIGAVNFMAWLFPG